MQNLESAVAEIQERNRRVEIDKAWETSATRKLSIAILTYLVITLFFVTADFPRPFLSALVPTAGYLLSTLTLSVIKKRWTKGR